MEEMTTADKISFAFLIIAGIVLLFLAWDASLPSQKIVDRCVRICNNNEMVFVAAEGLDCICRSPNYHIFSME